MKSVLFIFVFSVAAAIVIPPAYALASSGEFYNPLNLGISVTAKLQNGRSQRFPVAAKSQEPLPSGTTSVRAFGEIIGRDSKRVCSTPSLDVKDTDRLTLSWTKRDNRCTIIRRR